MTKMSQVSLASAPSRRNTSNGVSSTAFRYLFLAALVALGLVVVFSSGPVEPEQQEQEVDVSGEVHRVNSEDSQHRGPDLAPNEIVQGSWNGEAYYHCPANRANPSNKKVQDIVLWHGARFTKEEWKTSGILQKLCAVDHFSITAIDLSHRSDRNALKRLLHGLQDEQGLIHLPLAAIVTPSASGHGVVDWINHETAEFVHSIRLWVPVACPAVVQLQDEKMEELRRQNYPVLAIYGDQDPSGPDRSNLLGRSMNAEVVEIKGGHPCYLDSPDAFIETLTKRIENERLKNSQ